MGSNIEFEVEPFYVAGWLRGSQAQTIGANFLRRDYGVRFKRERIDTPDGDFIDLDFADVELHPWESLAADSPIVIHLHGLEGTARRGYACEAYRQLAQRGIRAIGMNFRSCSGEMNRTPGMYHAGATYDVATVVEWVDAQFPNVPKGLMGISLGGNMVLKYLGENGDQLAPTIQAAAVISPPFDMFKSSRKLLTYPGTMYGRRFIRYLKGKVRQKRHLLEDLIDVERLLQVRTLVEFDEYGTAPMYGFKGAEDYYRRNGCFQFMPGIRRPTLVLRALDDPLMDEADVPYDTFESNPCLVPGITQFGGHVGFVEGGIRKGHTFWAERQAARFFALHLLNK